MFQQPQHARQTDGSAHHLLPRAKLFAEKHFPKTNNLSLVFQSIRYLEWKADLLKYIHGFVAGISVNRITVGFSWEECIINLYSSKNVPFKIKRTFPINLRSIQFDFVESLKPLFPNIYVVHVDQEELIKALVDESGLAPSNRERLAENIRQVIATAKQDFAVGKAGLQFHPLAGRERWLNRKVASENPLQFIERVYPDRRAKNLILAELQYLDRSLYQAIHDWRRQRRDGTRNEIPVDFGLPRKNEVTNEIAVSADFHLPVRTAHNLLSSEKKIVRARKAMKARRARARKAATPM